MLIGSKPHINCKNMKIPNDICRCHGASCDTRYLCLRWLDRHGGDQSTPHAQILWDEDQVCYAFMNKDAQINDRKST